MHLEIPAFGQQKTPILSGFMRNISFLCSCYGGDGEIRTLDLSDANRTLYQLSYAPKCARHILTQFCRIGKRNFEFFYFSPKERIIAKENQVCYNIQYSQNSLAKHKARNT